MPALSMGGVTKSPLDETFEEFLESNHEYVEHGEQYGAEKAAFEKHQNMQLIITLMHRLHAQKLSTLDFQS